MLVHALCYLVDFLTYLEISDIYLHLRMIAQEIPARRGRFRKFAGLVTKSKAKSKENFSLQTAVKKNVKTLRFMKSYNFP